MRASATNKDLRTKTDEELADYMAGWKESSGNYILCSMEFKHRHNRGNEMRGWISLALSLLALAVSSFVLVVRTNR